MMINRDLMVRPGRTLAAGLATVCLAACASTSGMRWQPRADANLAADSAACEAQARGVNIQSPDGYSDGRYGAAAAMAGRMDRSDMRGGGAERVFKAVFETCMTRKGWVPAE